MRYLCSALLFAVSISVAPAEEPSGGPEHLKGLKFRSIGPGAGGRVARSCGVPGDPFTYYAATAAGGVWKSTDGGFAWKSIFDDQPVSSIGSIAVAPSDANVIYVGSGEANIRGNVAAGNGIYKSTDAGKTWKQVWKNIGQIGTMAVHPTNADIAYAAVLGNPFGPSENRGVYRTTDGGKTWARVLYKDEHTGASDVSIDVNNPRIVFAGLWQTRRRPWELTSGGPGSGLHVSHDGGDSWKQLTAKTKDDKETGLPKGIWGKICLAVAPSNGNRIYAMIEADEGGLFRSDNGGEKWEKVNDQRAIRQRAWYFSTITVDPTNAEVIFFPQVPLLKSIDGGKTLQRVKGPHHGDHHDIWIDPKNPKRIINSNDGGVDISVNGGETWYAPPLPIAQFYHIACDNHTPYRVAGSMQDIGTQAGPSNSLTKGILISDWENVGGGEAGHVAFDTANADVIYAGEYGGYISRFDRRTRQARNVGIYPYDPSGHGGEDLKVRFQWTAPIIVSPHDSKTVYHAGNFLFRTSDGGLSWEKISPDLTRNDKSKQKWSGGPITGDNTGVEIYCTIFAIAESPKQKGVLWAGSDDGLVHVSQDDGKTWSNVTANVPDLPDWGTVVCIEASPFDAGTAYLVVEAHRMSDFRPYLWKTTDFGKNWRSLTADLSSDEYLHVVRMDPKKKGLLYAGSEQGVWYSSDDGKDWHRLKLNLPSVAVHDIVVKGDDLVLGTMGRSIWIFDDLTPVREWTAAISKKPHLFPPAPATRWRTHGVPAEDFARSTGENPPNGASFTYQLPAKPKEITLEILDKGGKSMAKLTSKKEEKPEAEDVGSYGGPPEPKRKPLPIEPGVHRIAWSLKLDGAKKIPGAVVDSGDPEEGPVALPGEYTVKFTVDGKTTTTKLMVRPDPRLTESLVVSAGQFVPMADSKEAEEIRKLLAKLPALQFRIGNESILLPAMLETQHDFTVQLRDDITSLTKTVTQLRDVRKQLNERAETLKDEKSAKPLLDAGKKLGEKLDALEAKLHNPKAKTVYDILGQKGGAKLYSQLTALYAFTLEGDGPPTQGMKELQIELQKELKGLVEEWTKLVVGDVSKYNEQAKKLDAPGLWLPKEKKSDGAK
jgi:photosystem II stability/assembly factor-like uncharacterized protein